ncbi:hypothetical protein PQR34_30010 [Paraburkholderia sediminicola]|uniref:hypothetical protein n=1 Tax=Paraburkholderia sediminicola TaxID=458836 RepID=UPI0038BC2EC7
MWLLMNDSMLSVIASDKDENLLVVRARRPGDIHRVFGADVEEIHIPGRDYQVRSFLPRQRVADAIANRLLNTQYLNFKNSVGPNDNDLHDAYASVWHTLASIQPIPPFSRAQRGRQ